MKARTAKVTGPRKLTLVKENVPNLGEGEVLVRIEACGLCYTDSFVLADRKGSSQRKMVGV